MQGCRDRQGGGTGFASPRFRPLPDRAPVLPEGADRDPIAKGMGDMWEEAVRTLQPTGLLRF